ncbi:MAG: CHAD domain-containing protein [Thiobacillaceae bacterium]
MTANGKEIELKLLLPAGTKSLMSHPRMAAKPASRQRLQTIYFDTPDFKLAERGIALRVRRIGRRWIQTLKVEGNSSGGLSTRGELEVPVSGPGIEFERFPPEAEKYVPNSLRKKLVPVFETRFARRSRQVNGIRGSQIEVALDEGEIRAGERTEWIQELELELKSGRPDALFALAMELGEMVPLWPFDRSKAERGVCLARNIGAAPIKAKFPALDRRLPPADAWRVIATQCLRQLSANLPGIGYANDPEYLHQARVALRRFRSSYSLFKRGLPLPLVLLGELRKLNTVFGPARDWDVFCTETLPPLRAALPDSGPLEQLAGRADHARRHTHDQVKAYLQSPACGRLLLGLGRHLEESHRHFVVELGDPDLGDFAARHLKKRYRQMRAILANPVTGVAERHRLRISIKRLRYTLDCFSSLYSEGAVAGMTAALADLQTILGNMNDMAVADRLMASMEDDSAELQRARDLVHGWLAATGLKSEKKLGSALQKFSRIKRFW